MSDEVPLVRVGDVVTVAPEDFFTSYGIVLGPLSMRVTYANGDTRRERGSRWLQLMGVSLNADGTDGARVTAYVRIEALRANPPERPAERPAP